MPGDDFRAPEELTLADHAAPGSVEIIPVTGLPEFRPGDDLCAAIVAAAPWLRDGDAVVVTSKVVSKVEGRLVQVPADPEQRDARRRELVLEESVEVLAKINRTLITRSKLGLVQAASGVDASNIATDEVALLPEDSDRSAAALRARIAESIGVDVAVVITDTMGRAWRNGQTDAAIGSAGLPVLADYNGMRDSIGNDLLVTSIAIADEVAAAADLVKGKLGGIPVAVVRGLGLADDNSSAKDLIRPIEEDLFRLGTDMSIAQGRREAVLFSSTERFTDEPVADDVVRDAVAAALTGAGDVRFAHVVEQRKRVLDELGVAAAEVVLAGGDPFAAGAAVRGLVMALAAEGVGARWVPGPVRSPELSWTPLGAVVLGHPADGPPVPQTTADLDERFTSR
jgi:coenzyme F420-0:L-glutamate ligase/coenzyme F420-1:gamma-L-glutamate ligase